MSGRVLCTVPFSPPPFIPLADQLVLQQSELALLVSAHTAQDIISCCRFINETIPWDTLVALDAQAEPMAQFISIAADPLDQLLNLEAAQMRDSATYEQPNDLVNEYDGPVCCHALVLC